MPPILQCCLAIVVGLAAAPSLTGPVFAWALAALGAAGLSTAWGGALRAAGFATGVVLGLSLPAGPQLSGPVWVQGVRVGATAGRSGDVDLVRAAASVGSDWYPEQGRVRLRFPDRPPPAGTPVLAFGTAAAPTPSLPGAPDPVRSASLARIHSVVHVTRWVALDGDRSRPELADPTGVLRAVALGDRSEVAPESLTRLRRTGTAHLLAISGFHVGVVAMLAAGALRRLLRAGAVLLPSGLGSRAALGLGVVAAITYAVVAGAPVSALRAASLLALVAVGRIAGRTAAPLPLLGLVLAALAAADPSALATPGLQLSFGAVAGLLLLGPRLQRFRPDGRLRRWAFDGLAATTAATLGTLPAAAWWFQEVAPLSPVANLVAMPIMALGIVPCAGAALLLPAPLDAWAGWAGTWLVRGMMAALGPLEVAPLTPAVGATGAAMLAVVLPASLRWPGAGTVLTIAILGLRPLPRQPTLTVLDVGQGDALLVEHVDGTRVLVDGGPRRGEVLQWLRRRGVRRLDQVVLTHAERDHAGGLQAVVASLRVGEVWATTAEGLPEGVMRGAPPATLLQPLPGESVDNTNGGSAVLREGPFLLTGDIDAEAESRLALTLGGPVPVLKVPHHGSDTSSSEALLRVAGPALAVISVGRHNNYGHPHPSVLAAYAEHGIPVLRTDLHGTVVIRRTDRGLEARGSAGDVLTVRLHDPSDAAAGLLARTDADPARRGGEPEPPPRHGVGGAAVGAAGRGLGGGGSRGQQRGDP